MIYLKNTKTKDKVIFAAEGFDEFMQIIGMPEYAQSEDGYGNIDPDKILVKESDLRSTFTDRANNIVQMAIEAKREQTQLLWC